MPGSGVRTEAWTGPPFPFCGDARRNITLLDVTGVFFLVGPTAAGKSELAVDLSDRLNAEIVSADAFQIYRGFDLLSGKPGRELLRRARHHLVGTLPATETMDVEKFRTFALPIIREIRARRRIALVVGGSGLYVKALTHGLARLPPADPGLRLELESESVEALSARLAKLDPRGAEQIDRRNKRRLVRALEVCLITGAPFSSQRTQWTAAPTDVRGVLVLRERADLYQRIDRRIESMFASGVVAEVRAAGPVGATAQRMLGWRDIQELIAGRISEPECVSRIQQATRRYAKRQLTWFQHQINFPALNLSLQPRSEAIESIAGRVCAHG